MEKLICTIKQIGREWYRSLLISTIHQNHYLINRVSDKKKVTELFKKVSVSTETWLEDESQRIGRLIIPNSFWESMRKSPVFFLDIPFEERLNYLVNTYGNFEKEMLAESIERIQKRLGGLETKTAINLLAENNTRDCFSILLKYYDKLYKKGLHNRKNYESLLNIIPCLSVNSSVNVNKLSLQEA